MSTPDPSLSDGGVDFRTLFENAPSAYLVVTPGEPFPIVAVSEAYLQATMTNRTDIVGRDIFEVFPDNPADRTSNAVHNLRGSLLRVMNTGKADAMAIQKYDIRQRDGSFEERYWSPINSPVFGEAGRLRWILHRVEDVTEFVVLQQERAAQDRSAEELRTRMQHMATEIVLRGREVEEGSRRLERQAAELARSNDDLAHFAHLVSHDLQEPLRAIGTSSQLLARRFPEQLDREAQQLLESIIAGTQRLQRLIVHLLRYASAGNSAITKDPTDIRSVLQAAVNNLQTQIEENGAKVTHDELPTVCTDGVQLTQVFQNLISNALKYRNVDRTPEVHVSARRVRSEWLFSVADNGQGFDPQHAELVFGFLKRLHGHEIPGSGIGLALCRRIIDRLGGRIWAATEPAHGATFTFSLPD